MDNIVTRYLLLKYDSSESRYTALSNVSVTIQGGPKKVSHYRESSLNRVKNRQPGSIFHQF